MSRVLTGLQASGKLHLGNILGGILPALEMVKEAKDEYFFFIADLHALTSLKDPKQISQSTQALTAAFLALGLEIEKVFFYRQSQIPIVCELTWYLSTFAPYPMLANSHAFKSKSERLSDVNAGLFTYPILMAADILLYDAQIVPVGKDQIQHIEIARDIATAFNHHYGETFVLPELKLSKQFTVPGTDGQKMSKSYGNVIDIFQDDAGLKKQIFSIQTDSKALEEVKDPSTCPVFKIFEAVGDSSQIEKLKNLYLGGNFGYGQAKTALLELIQERFEVARKNYQIYIKDTDFLLENLQKGEEKVRTIAEKKISQIRKKMGFENKF